MEGGDGNGGGREGIGVSRGGPSVFCSITQSLRATMVMADAASSAQGPYGGPHEEEDGDADDDEGSKNDDEESEFDDNDEDSLVLLLDTE